MTNQQHDSAPGEPLAALRREIARLEERINTLEATVPPQPAAGTTLRAPVRIVDESGALLVEITRSRRHTTIRVFGEHGRLAASLGSEGAGGGYLAIRNEEGKLVGYFDVETWGARLQVSGNDRSGVILFGGQGAEDSGGGINIVDDAGGLSVDLWSEERGGRIRAYERHTEAVTAELPLRRRSSKRATE